jgi:hypothetical protein
MKTPNNTYSLQNKHFIFGTEQGSIDNPKAKGLLVSVIGNNKHNHVEIKDMLNYDSVRSIHSVYGTGTERGRCKHLGFSTYRGTRNSKRPHPTSFIDDNQIGDHQYYMMTQMNNALLQPKTESIIQKLGQMAEEYGKKEYKQLYNIVEDSCSKGILTCGSPSEYIKKMILQKHQSQYQ